MLNRYYSIDGKKFVKACKTRLFKTITSMFLGILLVAVIPLPVLAAGNGTTVGSLNLISTIECIGVYANFSDDDNASNSAILEYRSAGGTWKQGMALTVDRRATVQASGIQDNPWKNQFRGSIFGLTPDTQYEVRVTFTDTDGVSGTNPITATVTTKKDTFPLGSGTSRYVSTSGNDTNAGTLASPWQTIRHAVSAVSAGDTIYIRAGTYHEHSVNITRSGTANNYITMMPYQSESVIIDADNVGGDVTFSSCIWLSSASYWRIRGLTIQNIGSDHWYGAAGIRLFCGSSYNVIEYCTIKDFGYIVPDAGIIIQGGSNYNIIQYNTITSDRNGYSDANHRADGVCLYFLDGWWSRGLYPEYPGIGNVIRYNNIYSNNTGLGDGVGGLLNTDLQDGLYQDCDVYGNTISGIGDDAVECDGSAVNCRVWENTANNTCTGVSICPDIVGPLFVVRNVFFNQQQETVKFGKYDGEWDKGYAYFYHNSCYEPPSPGYAPFGLYGAAGGNTFYNFHSRNNIFYTSGYTIRIEPPSTDPSYGSDYDYDCLYQGTWISNRLTYWVNTIYTTLAAFRTASGQEAHGQGGYGTGDPLYVNTASGNLRLQASSPCINAGLVIPGFNDANSPWPYQGSAPDIGAYEL